MKRDCLTGFPKKLWCDRRGVSAIEFALIAPVMIIIYFGLVEFSKAYMVDRRSSHAASMVADMVAQSGGTSRKDLDSTFVIGDVIMRPFAPSELSIRVSSVTMDTRGVATVEWSRANGRKLAQRGRGSPIEKMAPDIIAANETVIMGESEYRYKLFIPGVLSKDHTFKRRYYLRPRSMDRIACSDC